MQTVSLHSQTKINQLLQSWPSGTVGLTVWLEEAGISRQLQQRYLKTGWLESISRGAFKRTGDTVDWMGALYAIQRQGGLDIHAGGRTALGMQGQAHYLELNQQAVHLFAPLRVSLPAWFRDHEWDVRLEMHHSDFLPPSVGLVDMESKSFSIKASGAARALMECLYLAPEAFELVEAYQIMEGLNTLRPSAVQHLLQKCRSVKVKRLFLFMAERSGHAWVKHLDLTKIETGRGKRSFAKGGVYVSKYQITVPKDLGSI